jgi:hypothetical protein
MGLSDIKKEGTFVWDYSGATYDRSLAGDSIYYKNHDEKDCVYYDGDWGEWYPTRCEKYLAYVCEMSLSE